MHKLIVITGPTAIGKTALSIQLANYFSCPILSFDSRQIYQEMTIGTAKPTAEELNQAVHYFIGTRTVKERYTAGMFEREALAKLNSIFNRHEYCIAVGGSGLYIDALAYGIDDIPFDPAIREKLNTRWKEEGLATLQEELLSIDPDFYHESDMKNPRRVIRALEVYQITNKTYSDLRKRQPKKRPFETYWIGLNMERELLFDRINKRVDLMVDEGLEAEVKDLLPLRNFKALNTVGYTELFTYFDGQMERETAIERIKKNTRQYAKRQITWFKKNSEVNWFAPTDFDAIVKQIKQKFL